MLVEPMVPIVVAVVALLILLGVWVAKTRWTQPTAAPASAPGGLIPAEISVSPQPLMTRAEASVYNLLRLAAQDHYLVFSQIPIWCVVDVKAADQKTRQAFLQQIALKRVDFALVHPGTLMVAKVVELEEGAEPSAQRESRNRFIDEILKTAGIDIVRLAPHSSSSVSDLATLIDLGPAES